VNRRYTAMPRLLGPGSPAAFRWGLAAVSQLRADLPTHGVRSVVSEPPALPRRAVVGVRAALRVRRATCLERCLILQRWFATHGVKADVIIGVRTGEAFGAHAWLDGLDRYPAQTEYDELTRIPAIR